MGNSEQEKLRYVERLVVLGHTVYVGNADICYLFYKTIIFSLINWQNNIPQNCKILEQYVFDRIFNMYCCFI